MRKQHQQVNNTQIISNIICFCAFVKIITCFNSWIIVEGSSSIKVGSGKPEPKTLYDRIGGEEAVTAAVGIFYKKMLADSKVAHFFKSTDMTK